MTMPLFQMASCCFSCFKGGFIVIVRMRSSMIVRCVSKFFYCCIQSFFCLVFMLIDQFIFLRVEISFHWSIIIWISCFTHALGYTKFFAKFRELFGSILASLIRMQHKVIQLNFRLEFNGFFQCPFCQISCYISICYTCNNTAVMKIYNCTIITLAPICKKQIRKISTPFLIDII